MIAGKKESLSNKQINKHTEIIIIVTAEYVWFHQPIQPCQYWRTDIYFNPTFLKVHLKSIALKSLQRLSSKIKQTSLRFLSNLLKNSRVQKKWWWVKIQSKNPAVIRHACRYYIDLFWIFTFLQQWNLDHCSISELTKTYVDIKVPINYSWTLA